MTGVPCFLTYFYLWLSFLLHLAAAAAVVNEAGVVPICLCSSVIAVILWSFQSVSVKLCARCGLWGCFLAGAYSFCI